MLNLKYAFILALQLICFFSLPGFAASEVRSEKDQDLVNLLQKNNLRLIIMRHGQAVHNLGHLMSSSPSPGIYLTDKGIQQIKESSKKLQNENIALIYVSPIYRAMQTAQWLSMELKIPAQNILIDPRIKEQFFGSYEGLTFDAYEAYFPAPEDVYTGAVPGGESGKEVYARALEFLKSIAEKHHDQTILIVTHAFVFSQMNQALTGSFDDIPGQAEFKIYPPQK